MSVFTNPASRSAEEAEAYTSAVLDLLGARDPAEVLQDTVSGLRRALEGLSPEQLGEPEAPGKWSVRQVLQHRPIPSSSGAIGCGWCWRTIARP